jgi:hypothetical protein
MRKVVEVLETLVFIAMGWGLILMHMHALPTLPTVLTP